MEKISCTQGAGYACASDRSALEALWNQAFEKEEAFAVYIFDRLFVPQNTIIWREGQEIVAAMHCFFYTLTMDGKAIDSVYFYGIATAKKARGQGIASRMIDFACKEMKTRGVQVAFLIPASDSLYSFYAALGFAPAFYLKKDLAFHFDNKSALTLTPPADLSLLNGIYNLCLNGSCYAKRNPDNWQSIADEVAMDGGALLCFEDKAYAICTFENKHLFIREAFSLNAKIDIISAAMCHFGKNVATVFSPAQKDGGYPYGVARLLQDKPDDVLFTDSFFTFLRENGGCYRPYISLLHN